MLFAIFKYEYNSGISIYRHYYHRQLRQQYVIFSTSVNPGHNLQQSPMVKVKDFCGAVFSPHDYELILHTNIEHLEEVPMSKTFNTAQMIASGRLTPQTEPFFYIYRQHYLNHTSFGVLAEISLQDYHENKIKKHEKTLHRPNLNHETYIEQHVGPVVVSHRQDAALDQLILSLTQQKPPFSAWRTIDGREHTLWRIRHSEASLSGMFAGIQALYILDGHHRLQAAHRNFQIRQNPSETDLWIQAIIYSSEYVMVHPQHRVLQNIPSNLEIVAQLLKMEHLEITEIGFSALEEVRVSDELLKYEIVLKLHEKMFGINFRNSSRNVLEKVPSFRLQNEIFLSFLDEDLLKKLKYVPGIIDQSQIYQHEIVFFVRQPEIQTLFQIADQSVTMPPKSTWIEPKPCSHMVIRLLG